MSGTAEGYRTLADSERSERLLRFLEQAFELGPIEFIGQEPAFNLSVKPGLNRGKAGGSRIGGVVA